MTTARREDGKVAGEGSYSGFRAREIVGSLLALTTVALAYPVLDLLGRNAAFFVARGAPWWEPVGLALALAVPLPLVVAAAVLLIRWLDPRAGALAHLVLLALLVALLATQVLDRLPQAAGLPLAGLAAAGLLAGVLASLAYLRSDAIRAALSLGFLVPLAACGLFLFASPVARLVLPTESGTADLGTVPRKPPIVLIVLDEFPVTSLMTADGGVDEELYPTFARLAEEGTWYRNTTTVDTFTTESVPAILTGNYPEPDELPIVADHPDTLFALLSHTYDVHALETVTELCSQETCIEGLAPEPTVRQRIATLSTDVSIVGGHVLLPEELRERLPPIGDAWGGFAEIEADSGAAAGTDGDPDTEPSAFYDLFVDAVGGDRRDDFARLRAAVQNHADRARPSFFFLHTLLPHQPWEYVPGGDRYANTMGSPGLNGDDWGSDEWWTAQGWQRHLLQVSAVDGMVGDVVAELERVGRYDDALVVVTADHGTSFSTGRDRRMMEADTIGDIAAVPLFIKYPGGAHAGVVDYPVESVDIAATILDVVGLGDEAATDGRSLLDLDTPERAERRLSQRGEVIPIAADGRYRADVLARKVEVFGGQGGSHELYSFGPFGQLVGSDLTDFQLAAGSSLAVALDQWAALADLDPAAEPLPLRLTGTVRASEPLVEDRYLAVVLDGKVQAIAKTFGREGSAAHLSVMVPQDALVPGANDLQLFEIESMTDAAPTLRPVEIQRPD